VVIIISTERMMADNLYVLNVVHRFCSACQTSMEQRKHCTVHTSWTLP